jgi:hypothetical protein
MVVIREQSSFAAKRRMHRALLRWMWLVVLTFVGFFLLLIVAQLVWHLIDPSIGIRG